MNLSRIQVSARELARVPALKSLQRSMTRRQWVFAVNYVALGAERGVGAEAARRAGWAKGSADRRAYEQLRVPVVNAAIGAIRQYIETIEEIDERFIFAGLAKEAVEGEDSKDRVQALIALAKLKRLGAFGGQAQPGNSGLAVTQNVLVLQQAGIDAQSGRVSDASKFADALGRAFGADQASAMLAQLGMQAPERVLEHADISPDAGLEVLQAIDCEPGDSVTD